MIDYLERLFVRREEDASPASHAQIGEEMQPLSAVRIPDGEVWQQDAVRRLERTLAVPASGEFRLSAEQPEPLQHPALAREEPAFQSYAFPETYLSREMDGTQELERRLRRDSRRYDSGFFLY